MTSTFGSAQYQVRLFDTTGTLVAVFDNPNSIYYFKRLNDFWYHTISINGADSRRKLFATDAIIEVWRRITDGFVANPGWTLEYEGFHRTDQFQVTDSGLQLYTSYGRGFVDLLHRRAILYYAGTPGDTKSGFADDVAKAYVRENCGSLATVANGRVQDGVIAGFAVDTDISAAPSWSGSNSWENLLQVLQQIVATIPFDFYVTRVPPVGWQFQTFYPRFGTDRTGAGTAAPVIFSTDHGNMSNPYAVFSRTDEVNSIIVLGSGDGTNREVVIRADLLAEDASPWNMAEKTHDSRNASSTAALESDGDAQLAALRTSRHITFVNLESVGSRYGRDYGLGDLIVARVDDQTQNKKITGVEVTVSQGTENIRLHFDDDNVVPTP